MQAPRDLPVKRLRRPYPSWLARECFVFRSRAMCAARLVAAAQATVYSFSARPLAGGEPLSLGSLRGKVLLIENVASL